MSKGTHIIYFVKSYLVDFHPKSHISHTIKRNDRTLCEIYKYYTIYIKIRAKTLHTFEIHCRIFTIFFLLTFASATSPIKHIGTCNIIFHAIYYSQIFTYLTTATNFHDAF